MNYALILFRDRIFTCQTPFFPFLGRNMVWSASLGFLLVHRTLWHSPLTMPTSPALGHDFSWFCSSLTLGPQPSPLGNGRLWRGSYVSFCAECLRALLGRLYLGASWPGVVPRNWGPGVPLKSPCQWRRPGQGGAGIPALCRFVGTG